MPDTVWLAMKIKAVSALRSKRGLRPVKRVARATGCGTHAPNNNETKSKHHEDIHTAPTQTCRSHKNPPANPALKPPKAGPPPPSSWDARQRPPTAPSCSPVFDVHTDSIAVSLAPSDSVEVRRYGIIGGEHDDVLKLLTKLQAAHPGTELRCCYQKPVRMGFPSPAACTGTAMFAFSSPRPDPAPAQRPHQDQPPRCRSTPAFTAPANSPASMSPIPPMKPSAVEVRAREQVRDHQHRSRQQLKMFLLRHNLLVTPDSPPWSPAHLRYLAKLKLPFFRPADRLPGNA